MNDELLSPVSTLRLRFDQISPETTDDENVVQKSLWGFPVPPFVSGRVVSWIENELQPPTVTFNEIIVEKKVFLF